MGQTDKTIKLTKKDDQREKLYQNIIEISYPTKNSDLLKLL